MNPNNDYSYVVLGNIATDRKDYATALKNYTQSLEIQPGNVETRLRRANTRLKAGDRAGALADFKKMADTGTSDDNFYVRMVRSMMKARFNGESLPILNER
jgi:tetratricopeptide (TPR) repeat protein